ncbi:hypothetical protein RCL1_008181 [Eukaryota sp. TZLM3-RCL]
MSPMLKNRNQLDNFKLQKSQFSQEVRVQNATNPEAAASDDEFLGSLQSPIIRIERDEFERYQEMTPIDIRACPLGCWKVHQAEFPVFATLAKDFLAIPATCVPCERVFSVAGHIKSKKRNRLADDSLTLLRDWLSNGYDILEACSEDEIEEAD